MIRFSTFEFIRQKKRERIIEIKRKEDSKKNMSDSIEPNDIKPVRYEEAIMNTE